MSLPPPCCSEFPTQCHTCCVWRNNNPFCHMKLCDVCRTNYLSAFRDEEDSEHCCPRCGFCVCKSCFLSIYPEDLKHITEATCINDL